MHTEFLKRNLGVKRGTSNAMIYSETGRVSLITRRKFNMAKHCLKLTKSENCILKSIYETELQACMGNMTINWIMKSKQFYIVLGCLIFGYVSSFQTKELY